MAAAQSASGRPQQLNVWRAGAIVLAVLALVVLGLAFKEAHADSTTISGLKGDYSSLSEQYKAVKAAANDLQSLSKIKTIKTDTDSLLKDSGNEIKYSGDALALSDSIDTLKSTDVVGSDSPQWNQAHTLLDEVDTLTGGAVPPLTRANVINQVKVLKTSLDSPQTSAGSDNPLQASSLKDVVRQLKTYLDADSTSLLDSASGDIAPLTAGTTTHGIQPFKPVLVSKYAASSATKYIVLGAILALLAALVELQGRSKRPSGSRDRTTLPPPALQPEVTNVRAQAPIAAPAAPAGKSAPAKRRSKGSAARTPVSAPVDTGDPAGAFGRGDLGPLSVLAVSVVGAEHTADGGRREDSFAVTAGKAPGVVICAVADGVGSTHASHLASYAAAQHAVKILSGLSSGELSRLLADDGLWRSWVPTLTAAVAREVTPAALITRASEEDADRVRNAPDGRSPACTLSVAIISPQDRGLVVAWAAVGDSPILAWEPHLGRIVHLSPASPGGPVDALPTRPDQVIAGMDLLTSDATVLLTSDGMAEVLLRELAVTPQIIAAQRVNAPQEDLLTLVGTPVLGAHDDRTLVAVTGRHAPGQA